MKTLSFRREALAKAQLLAADYRTSKRSRYTKRAEWYGSYLVTAIGLATANVGDRVWDSDNNSYLYNLACDAGHFANLALENGN